MTHDWIAKHYPGGTNELPSEECTKCGLIRSPHFYSNIPNTTMGQIFSVERYPEPKCDLMILSQVINS
jgi:hypothetical protein